MSSVPGTRHEEGVSDPEEPSGLGTDLAREPVSRDQDQLLVTGDPSGGLRYAIGMKGRSLRHAPE